MLVPSSLELKSRKKVIDVTSGTSSSGFSFLSVLLLSPRILLLMETGPLALLRLGDPPVVVESLLVEMESGEPGVYPRPGVRGVVVSWEEVLS